MELNWDTVIKSDCLEFMKTMPEDSIDVVITSPPYAEKRVSAYGTEGVSIEAYPEWMKNVGSEIKRILKPSGSFVLNLKEHVVDGARSTYVLKTVLALSEMFVWGDTFIWNKTNPFPTGSKNRLKDGFEYCFHFAKTKKYKFNPNAVLMKSQSKYLESEMKRKNKGSHNVKNGSGMNMGTRYVSDMVRPSNVITLAIDCTNHEHPATFPIGLPEFFIKLLTDENDVVYDPFAGSGTTLVSALKLNRHWLGTEINERYVNIIRDRIEKNKV